MLNIALVISNFLLLQFATASGQRGEASLFNENEAIPLRKSKEVPGHMNLKADPCHDFYDFACGNWTHTYNASGDEISLTMEAALDLEIAQVFQNVLRRPITLEDKINERKLKDFYSSCIVAERNGPAQQEHFSALIQTHRGFPAVPGSDWYSQSHNYNWQDVIGVLRFQYGMNILVGVKIDINYLYTAEDSIYLGVPDTIIPPELCNTAATQSTNIYADEYVPIRKEVAENLHNWLALQMDAAYKVATDLLAFEYELCTSISPKTNAQPIQNNSIQRKTLYEFTHQFNNKIDFVASVYGTPIPKPAFMTAEAYFNHLITTVNETNKTTIANYIMYRALSTISFPHNDVPDNRPTFCFNLAKRYFPKDMGQMYYKKYADVTAKDDILYMFEKLKESLQSSFQQAWLEDVTRRTGETRLAEIHLAFARYEKLEVNLLLINRTDYWHNLLQLMKHKETLQFRRISEGERQAYVDEVEAYDTRLLYRQHDNRIEIGFGLFQEPLYHQTYPNSVRYAVIGQKLAHMLAVAFDDLAWTSNNLLSWDHITAFQYRKRSECFRQHIGNYLHNAAQSFQNVTQLRQMIATSGGLNIAFNAYLNWLAFLNPNNDFSTLSKETLTEFNFTNTQLFFIAFAQMHCTANNSTKTKTRPTFSPFENRSIERYAVNGPLQNSVEFARDFGCLAGVEMNPPDKCVIY